MYQFRLASLLLLVGLAIVAWQISPRQSDKSDYVDVSEPDVRANARNRIISIQRRFAVAEECDARLTGTIYFQGPTAVRIAWQRPDIFFIQADQFGENPRQSLWYENGELSIYEEWPKRGHRGIAIRNFIQAAGNDREQAFALVYNVCGGFVPKGQTGLETLGLLRAAITERLQISESEWEWRCTGSDEAFESGAMEPFRSGTQARTRVTFVLPKRPRAAAGISRVVIGFEDQPATVGGSVHIPPEAGVLMEIDSLRFTLDRRTLQFPVLIPGAVRDVMISSPDDLLPELVDSLRFASGPEPE